ncbi:hypothetical protein I79_010463 [Cricetulus griseus]|uniref:Uncharacterized protein n=1 Tax=Cricetulus griseus TaxID=10029 RepID=G3HIJ2_CRIGR|nr:hypothetical protein I79_010463 [Cricetulus griseus]
MRESEHRSLEQRRGKVERGTHMRDGLLPKAGGCGIKGKKPNQNHTTQFPRYQ